VGADWTALGFGVIEPFGESVPALPLVGPMIPPLVGPAAAPLVEPAAAPLVVAVTAVRGEEPAAWVREPARAASEEAVPSGGGAVSRESMA
jgi:hypothetical protein